MYKLVDDKLVQNRKIQKLDSEARQRAKGPDSEARQRAKGHIYQMKTYYQKLGTTGEYT